MSLDLPLSRRAFAAIALACAANARAQDAFPSRPIRVVVPFPPGGGGDSVLRFMGPLLTRLLGQPLVVDNRAGAGGSIGASFVAKAPADGYTLLLSGTNSMSIYPALSSRSIFDPTQVEGVARIGISTFVLVTRPDYPAADVRELLNSIKARKEKINFASGGNGTANHLAIVLLQNVLGVRVTHIPYKGGGPAIADVVAGMADMTITSLPGALTLIQAGKLKAYATTGATRSTLMNSLPTLREAGVKDFEIAPWLGLSTPAGTPPAVIATLDRAVVESLRDGEVRKHLESSGVEISYMSAAPFNAFVEQDRAIWKDLVKKSGATID